MAAPKSGALTTRLVHTSALPYARGGPISVVDVSPHLRPRTDGARTVPCCSRSDSKTATAMTTGTPTYESQRAMRAAAAAATAQQGYDSILMLEMLEDEAIEALAAEIKEFALEWVRSGIAWWNKGGNVDRDSIAEECRRTVIRPGTAGEESPAALMADAAQKSTSPPPQQQQKRKVTLRAGRWAGEHIEVKRKEEEQRKRAKHRPHSMPSMGSASTEDRPSREAASFSSGPTLVALQDTLKPLPALPTAVERTPKQVQQARSFWTGRRHSASQDLRRRRAGGRGSVGGDGDGCAAQVDIVGSVS
ncbi:hypothetical protein JCM3774_004044 [Rhodotorula dairenensis]